MFGRGGFKAHEVQFACLVCQGVLEALIWAACVSVEALMTNSRVSSMLMRVSFFVASRFKVGEKATIGGLAPKTLKKLNGARLITP